jgi:MFS family permease
VRWYAVIVINMFFVGILFGFLPVRVHALGYAPAASGALLAVVALSYLLIQPVAGIAAERAGTGLTIRIGLAVSALSLIALAVVSGPLFVICSIAAGFGIGIVWTNTDTLVSGLAASGQLGATMGAAGSFKELGDMLGPVTIGLLAQVFGLAAGFIICGVLGLLALTLVRQPRAGVSSATT